MATRAGEQAERLGESRSDRRREILDGLAGIINEIAGISVEDVHMSDSFADDLDIDSLSMVEVLVAAEELFALQIPDEDVRSVTTVREAVDYISRRSRREQT
ncbi:acyl carrier protein [Streptomyces sp. NPDC127079]|uniref:acyl carrier protein n=1 Tax=Streptomyces sp. NPDC127079 TaxID=3347132 RepID=UPI00364B5CFD